ncbi:MAG: hypothetical protein FWG10_04680 [Eubacteriaceae bacterium]|nr:hypothetical protein [Eubacteriaceae bacterium]
MSKTSGEVRIAEYEVEKEACQVREKIGIIFSSRALTSS